MIIENLDAELQIDFQLKDDFERILNDLTPLSWLKYSYPGYYNLPNYLTNLQERIEYINQLMSQDSKSYFKFWLPGFFD